jgi:hypothetical protein
VLLHGERLENGEWSYSTPLVFEEFQKKLPDFQGTCNVFKNRPGTIPELMQVITDNCNLIDVPTLQRSFKYEAKSNIMGLTVE